MSGLISSSCAGGIVMSGGAFLAAVFFIVIGLLCVFARDLMWELTHFNNRMKGVASERTELWDFGTVVGGIAAVILGTVVLVIGFTQ
jgi:hypothetical protein